MRIGVLGLGSIGRRHVGNLLALGCDVVGSDVSESARERVRSEFPSVEIPGGNMGHLDAVVIATPWDQHLASVEAALRVRMPFFVEKPLGSLEQLPRWREIAAMDLPINQVGYMLRFHETYLAMRRLIPEPTGGQFNCHFNMNTWPGGAYGPMNLEASHELDLALDCGLSYDAVTVRDDAPYLRGWYLERVGASVEASFDSAEELGTDMYRAELEHFLSCVREQTPTSVPLADGLRVLEAVAQVETLCQS
jgi:predicted dehydrogenase